MKAIATLVALFAMLSLVAGQYPCTGNGYNQTTPSCKSCQGQVVNEYSSSAIQFSICSSCLDGFWFQNSSCTACPTGAKYCDYNGFPKAQTSCLSGYVWNQHNLSCVACPANCKTCTWASNSGSGVVGTVSPGGVQDWENSASYTICTTTGCATGYFWTKSTNTTQGTCTALTDKNCLSGTATACTGCDTTNGWYLNNTSTTQCISCQPKCQLGQCAITGAAITASTCNAPTGIQVACTSAQCYLIGTGCQTQTFGANFPPGQCMYSTANPNGYYIKDNCGQGYAWNATAADCVANAGCAGCAAGYCGLLASSVACYQATTGYYIAANKIAACPLNCAQCNSGGCLNCNSGFGLLNNGSCIPCQGNCTTCDQNGICQSCLSGFYLPPNACPPCPANCTICVNNTVCGTGNLSTTNQTSVCNKGYVFNNVTFQCIFGEKLTVAISTIVALLAWYL